MVHRVLMRTGGRDPEFPGRDMEHPHNARSIACLTQDSPIKCPSNTKLHLGDTAVKRPFHSWGLSALLMAHGVASVAVAQTETQSFPSAATAQTAGWIANPEATNPDRQCNDAPCATDLGWKNSNFAGGAAAGEGGGLLHRSGGLPVGFYADTTVGTLSLDMPLTAKGKVAFQDLLRGRSRFPDRRTGGRRRSEPPLGLHRSRRRGQHEQHQRGVHQRSAGRRVARF
jgi:hypothetical protein